MRKRLISPKKRESIKKINASFIKGLSDAQIDNYIDNQIKNLTDAKVFLKKLSKVVLYLLKFTGVQ